MFDSDVFLLLLFEGMLKRGGKTGKYRGSLSLNECNKNYSIIMRIKTMRNFLSECQHDFVHFII